MNHLKSIIDIKCSDLNDFPYKSKRNLNKPYDFAGDNLMKVPFYKTIQKVYFNWEFQVITQTNYNYYIIFKVNNTDFVE